MVMHQLITADQCRRAVDWLHSRGLEFYLESNSGLFASEHFAEKSLPALREYSRRKGKASFRPSDRHRCVSRHDFRGKSLPGRLK